MNERLDTIIDLLQEISNKMSTIEEALDRMDGDAKVIEEQGSTTKTDENYGFVRGADYYANLDERKQ